VVLVMMKVQGPICMLQEVAAAAVDEGCRQQWLARLAYQDGRRWQLKVRGAAHGVWRSGGRLSAR
jgi:hypothetical protein